MPREMCKSRFYGVKTSDTMRIVGEENACIGCLVLGVGAVRHRKVFTPKCETHF